jgi:hypothetical protein
MRLRNSDSSIRNQQTNVPNRRAESSVATKSSAQLRARGYPPIRSFFATWWWRCVPKAIYEADSAAFAVHIAVGSLGHFRIVNVDRLAIDCLHDRP